MESGTLIGCWLKTRSEKSALSFLIYIKKLGKHQILRINITALTENGTSTTGILFQHLPACRRITWSPSPHWWNEHHMFPWEPNSEVTIGFHTQDRNFKCITSVKYIHSSKGVPRINIQNLSRNGEGKTLLLHQIMKNN